MLSILIPTHNYNITGLVGQLQKQLLKVEIIYEIIVYDNGSKKEIIEQNKQINELKNTLFLTSTNRDGIAVARKFLSEKAKYNWILLLDADTEIKHENYIENYYNQIKSDYEVIFGGFAYKNKKPLKNEILRWKYGKKHESLSANQRNQFRYKITIAANLLIKKQIYQSLNLHQIGTAYGMDLLLGPQLKKNKIPVLHIDNEVYHIGLETNTIYLNKVELAIKTLLSLHNQNSIDSNENDLLITFKRLKRIKLNYLLSLFYTILRFPLKLNLLGRNPSIRLLQLYKLLFISHFELNHNNLK